MQVREKHMKYNTVLIIDGNTSVHESTEAAIEHSSDPKFDDAKVAHIYAYQMTARKAGFRWNTEKPKVVRTEPAEKRTMKRWSQIEQDLLVQAKKEGKTDKVISDLLCRTERAIQLRWNKTRTIKRAIQNAKK